MKCHLDDKKNFACDMYVAYVMFFLFFTLLLTSVRWLSNLGSSYVLCSRLVSVEWWFLSAAKLVRRMSPSCQSPHTDVSRSVKNQKKHYACKIHIAGEIFFVIQMAFHIILYLKFENHVLMPLQKLTLYCKQGPILAGCWNYMTLTASL